MTKQYVAKKFTQLEDWKKRAAEQQQRRAEITENVTRLKADHKLKQAEYDALFKAGVESGKLNAKQLEKLDGEIDALAIKIQKAERDQALFFAAQPDNNDELPAIVEAFRTEYAAKAREELRDIERKLQTGIDIILSARADHQALREAYYPITREVYDISKANHTSGRTSAWMSVSNPVEFLGGKYRSTKVAIERLAAAYDRNEGPENYIEKLSDITKMGEK